MKPWVVSVQVTLLDRFSLLAQQPPLDAALYARAEADGKEVGGSRASPSRSRCSTGSRRRSRRRCSETPWNQIDRYRRERRDPTEELVAAYVSGEDARVTRLLEEDFDPQDPLDVKVRQRLFTDRNARMADRITACLRAAPPRAYLFAVGAGHVVGADGLVARLERPVAAEAHDGVRSGSGGRCARGCASPRRRPTWSRPRNRRSCCG
jgi:hypothetical protein